MPGAASGGGFLSPPFPCGDSLLKPGRRAWPLRPFPYAPLAEEVAEGAGVGGLSGEFYLLFQKRGLP